MRGRRAAAVALSLAVSACAAQSIKREVHVHEQALLLPEAIGPSEPRADRVTILQATGRTLVFEDVVVGRDGDVLVVRGAGEPTRVPLGLARAIQIERELAGPERARLVAEDQLPPDVVVTPAWVAVLGIAAMVVTAVVVVNEVGE